VATDLDYLAHLAAESARFAAVARDLPAGARVPTCPGWDADDLLWHLGEVQWFWGTIVRDHVTGARAEELKPPRPADRAGLLDFFERASRDLAEGLAARPPAAPAWTWSDDQTVGFIRRRQAHEALIHRVDAELTAGTRSPMDPWLSADGVDEMLRVMYGGDVPAWGTFTPAGGPAGGAVIRFHAADTGRSWLVTLGRFTGTDPRDAASYDEDSISVTGDGDGGAAAAATVSGSAADLDCWLWRRPPVGEVTRTGDEDLLDRFGALMSGGVN
jgi:uncharacterized protein (TIGR03083 family)